MSDLRQSVTLQELAFRYKYDQRLSSADRETFLRAIGLFAVDWLTQDCDPADHAAPLATRPTEPAGEE